MKLVELLARELDEWADTTSCYTQDRTITAWPWTGDSVPTYTASWQNTHGSDIDQNDSAAMLDLSEVAEDHSTAIVTREMWEAERARIKGEKSMTKPNKDGWIRHRGGKCPVDKSTPVDIKLRNGDIASNCKAMTNESDHEMYFAYDWTHTNHRNDIMAWRPHKPVEQRIIEAEQSALASKANAEAESPAAKYFDGPIQWRDRIRELDEQREEVCALYNRQVAEIKEERASLVAKLKAEGFALIQGEEKSTHQDIAQQDMSDPANWRVGDLFEIIGEDSHEFPMGDLVKLIVFENDHDEEDGHRYAYLGDSDYWWVRDCNVRWHSRPPQ